MIRRMTDFLSSFGISLANSYVIAAVSGGADSVVMLQLLRQSGAKLAVAHCNFGLRGEESDFEEDYVRQLSVDLGIPFFVQRFDTTGHASRRGISIQMAARELRYTWFEVLLNELNACYVATAHHSDDSAETFFINLIRGSGPAGLKGIPFQRGAFIRPLLFARRSEIEQFAADKAIKYLTDSSNLGDKYLRNAIRHHVIPAFDSCHINARKGLMNSLLLQSKYETTLDELFNLYTGGTVSYFADGIEFNKNLLLKLKYPEVILHQLVSRYGFGGDLITQIAHSIRRSGVKKFTSPTHILVIERNKIHVSRLVEETEQVFFLEAGFTEIFKPVKLSAGRVPFNDNIPLKVPQHIALFDETKLEYPLVVRTWNRGDYFYPFGMKGRKLLSDFFSDNKFDSIQKKNAWILCNTNRDIIWIVGYRADRRFCVDEQTRHVLRLELT